jgi:uncharacterized membrane protein YbhN (UPF0104 family)
MFRLFQFAVSIGLLAGLFWWMDAAPILASVTQAHAGWLAASLAGLILSTLSMAHRWQLTARRLGMAMPYLLALREYYLSQFLNSVLPGGVLGDVGRAIRARGRGNLRRAGQSVLAERLIGQVAVFAITGLGLSAAWLWPGGPDWPWPVALALPCVLGAGAMAMVCTRHFGIVGRFVRLVGSLLREPLILLHAVLAAGLLIFSLYACARATGTIIPSEGWFTVLPLILCAMLVPLSVAGWGWREAAAVALVPMVGASPEAGLAMGLCYGALMFLASLPAVFFLFSRTGQDNAHVDTAQASPPGE